MAKRIEFVAPVEAMRGNLSGNQDLVYAQNDNRAFESPVNQVNYAKNYQTRYIGAKRASDGLKYFGVKTRSGFNNSDNAQMAMAVLGAAGAVYVAIRAAGGEKWEQIQYNYAQAFHRQYKSLRQYCMSVIMRDLRAKARFLTFGGPTVAQYQNPWITPGQEELNIGLVVLAKFWVQLSMDGIQFTISGARGVASTGDTFNSIIGSPIDVLNLETETIGGTKYVKYAGGFVMSDATTYAQDTTTIEANKKYFLSYVAPTA